MGVGKGCRMKADMHGVDTKVASLVPVEEGDGKGEEGSGKGEVESGVKIEAMEDGGFMW